ncbi:hypothetical protein BsWGS_23274 [Bradybaena similaris]
MEFGSDSHSESSHSREDAPPHLNPEASSPGVNATKNGIDDNGKLDDISNCGESKHSWVSGNVSEHASDCASQENIDSILLLKNGSKSQNQKSLIEVQGQEDTTVACNAPSTTEAQDDKKCEKDVIEQAPDLEQSKCEKVACGGIQNTLEIIGICSDLNEASATVLGEVIENRVGKTCTDIVTNSTEHDSQKPGTSGFSEKQFDIPPPIFEDITDEEDEEAFENIELELDDLIEPAELSGSSGGSEGDKSEQHIYEEESLFEQTRDGKGSVFEEADNDRNECPSEPDRECVQLERDESSLSSDRTPIGEALSDCNSVSNVTTDPVELKRPPSSSVFMMPDSHLEKDKNSKIYTILTSSNSFKAALSDSGDGEHSHKQKLTARKSGKPINQIDSSALKTINLHPIKNITMKLSDVQGALDCDPLFDSGSVNFRTSESVSNAAADLNGPLMPSEINSGKVLTGLKKKRRKKNYDFPGCKKKLLKRPRSDELESISSSADSVSFSDIDLQDTDVQKDTISRVGSVTTTTKSDLATDTLMKNSHLSFSKKPKSSASPSSGASSLITSSSLSSSSSPSMQWSSAPSLPKPAHMKPNSKMKSVLDMLHARSKQKAEQEEKNTACNTVQTICVTTSATSTTTTILVSPPPNKPIVEGVKRKGTPRKRRDSDESAEKKLAVEGKRKRDSTDSNTTSSTPTPPLKLKQKTPSALTQAPVVMVVAQHSSAPGLRSLLPRNALVSPTSPSTGKIVQPTTGTMLSSFPLISALPVGAKAVSLASLPPGVTALPMTSLPPGSQPPMTFFTTVPASVAAAVPIPITGANLVSLSSPVQLISTSPGKSIKTTSAYSESSLLPSIKTSGASPIPSNSDSLRALLVGKPYTFSRIASVTSAQLSSTPMLFHMVTATAANLLQSSAQPVTVTASSAAAAGKLKHSSVSKSSYSLLKSNPPVVPNGISCLTPPKTPDTDSSSEVAVAASLSRPVPGQVEDSEVIPLCCCKINGASFNKLLVDVTYCQALDTVDNKVLGCYNKVTNPQLVRPGIKIPFMAVCEVHRRRLKLHQCCPGCGHFCSQGKFQQCRKEGQSSVHNFHKQCVFYRGGKYYCPHCGEETSQCEIELQLNEDRPEETKLVQSRAVKREPEKRTARICSRNFKKSKSASAVKVNAIMLPNNKSINIDALPLGPEHQTLNRLCRCVNDERPKKYRTLPKDLYTPAYEGDLEKVFYLLIDGMDANIRYEDYDDQTALHAAAMSGSVGVVFILAQFGAEIHAQDKSLRTPVMCAAENGNLKAVQFLIKAGAKVEDKGEDGMTGLHYAAKAGYLDVVKHILETGKVNINIQDDGGWTPIMWATELQMVEVVKYLLTQGGDPNKKDNEENTSLHWAAFSGSLKIAEMFLDSGCEIDAVNEHGDRPLHIAARQDHYDMVVLLLARGADVDTKNNKSESPVESCTNKTGQVWMALKVNQQLRSFAAWKSIRPERLIERDITMGREKNPVACVNSEDNEQCPVDYLYVTENVETSPLNINYVITSLQSCRCKDDCSSMYCVCGRSSIKCWYDKMGRLLEEVNLLEPPLVFECNRACRCWVNCNNRVVQNGITCRLQMFKTNGRGWGVRALMDIPKGTFVCEYIGELISDSEADRREDDSYLFDLDNKDGDTYCIDARRYGNISRFINHLCEPNLVPVKVFVEHQDLRFPRICLFSSREIKAYEELGFDYGEKFWMIKWKHFTCACKSAKCKYSSETINKTLADYKLRYPDENVDI